MKPGFRAAGMRIAAGMRGGAGQYWGRAARIGRSNPDQNRVENEQITRQ